MFDVGIPELLVIALVGIIAFGPDRLPDYARQLGRMIRQLRKFAQSAQNDLREELGPEFADLKLTDLDPRSVIRKHVLEAMDEDAAAVTAKSVDVLGPDEKPPFDAEAT